jgi:hypothetical protein
MSGPDIAAWVFLAIGALAVAWRVVALAIGPAWARRPVWDLAACATTDPS